MLENEWQEAKENLAKITDFDPATVTLAIRHCYDVDIDIKFNHDAFSLLQFADKYELNVLKVSVVIKSSLKIIKI